VAGVPATVLLHLRQQDAEELAAVGRGQAVDIVLGDPTFDAAWIVEGAPAERVTRILKHPYFWQQLMALSQFRAASVLIEDGKITIGREGDERKDAGATLARLELALALAQAVTLDAAAPLPASVQDIAAGYRTPGRIAPDASGAARIAELKVVRGTRAIAELRPLAMHGNLIVSVIMALMTFQEVYPALAAQVLFLGSMLVASLAVLWRYYTVRRDVPGVALDRPALWAMALAWSINVAFVLRVVLARRS